MAAIDKVVVILVHAIVAKESDTVWAVHGSNDAGLLRAIHTRHLVACVATFIRAIVKVFAATIELAIETCDMFKASVTARCSDIISTLVTKCLVAATAWHFGTILAQRLRASSTSTPWIGSILTLVTTSKVKSNALVTAAQSTMPDLGTSCLNWHCTLSETRGTRFDARRFRQVDFM